MGTEQYGKVYFGIKTDISPDWEVYAMADVVETASDGSLILRRKSGGRDHINLIVPAGHWTACYAASVIDGAAVAVEHWKGEVLPREGSGAEIKGSSTFLDNFDTVIRIDEVSEPERELETADS